MNVARSFVQSANFLTKNRSPSERPRPRWSSAYTASPLDVSCWAAHSYRPLCAFNPWEITTTPWALPAGCHSRVKILTPPTPSKLPSVMHRISPSKSPAARSGGSLKRHFGRPTHRRPMVLVRGHGSGRQWPTGNLTAGIEAQPDIDCANETFIASLDLPGVGAPVSCPPHDRVRVGFAGLLERRER